jgi:hypothetical protein
VRAGRQKTKGKRAGEDPHPKEELRRQLVAAAERRGGAAMATKTQRQWRRQLGREGERRRQRV